MDVKLYRFGKDKKEYWEVWQNDDGSHIVHWGELGSATGNSRTMEPSLDEDIESSIQGEVDRLIAKGFRAIDIDDHATLLIEYAVDEMGTGEDVQKRHRLEELINETLGWTGLGVCDGGSIGSGTMEVCNYVVDFELAKSVIEKVLAGTEFADYTRIYDEEAD